MTVCSLVIILISVTNFFKFASGIEEYFPPKNSTADPLAVFLIHGLTLSGNSLLYLEKRIKENSPRTEVFNTYAFSNAASFVPLQQQMDGELGKQFREYSDKHTRGFIVIGHSQGALLAFALIASYPQHNVRILISIAGPLYGQYGGISFQHARPCRNSYVDFSPAFFTARRFEQLFRHRSVAQYQMKMKALHRMLKHAPFVVTESQALTTKSVELICANIATGIASFLSPIVPLLQLPPLLALSSALFLDPIGQAVISVANFWHDPIRPELYLQQNKYLTYYLNEVWSNDSTSHKRSILNLTLFVAIAGPDDAIVIPWESGVFAFLNEKKMIVNFTQQEIFKKDTFGLRTLYETGRFITHIKAGVEHLQWIVDNYVIKEFILKYLY